MVSKFDIKKIVGGEAKHNSLERRVKCLNVCVVTVFYLGKKLYRAYVCNVTL